MEKSFASYHSYVQNRDDEQSCTLCKKDVEKKIMESYCKPRIIRFGNCVGYWTFGNLQKCDEEAVLARRCLKENNLLD